MITKRTSGLNLEVLEDRETLMNFGDEPRIDIATGTFMAGWHTAGKEPVGSSHGETRNVTSTKTQLTGGHTATSYTAGDMTGTVDLIKGSPVLDKVEWPDTIAGEGGVLYRRHTSEVAQAYVARVYKYQSGIVQIKASREKAGLTIADRTSSTDPTPRSIAIDYANGDDSVAFEEMFYHIAEDGTVTQVEKKIFQNITDVEAQVAAGTAFVPEASAAGVSAYVAVTDEDGLVEFDEPEAPAGP